MFYLSGANGYLRRKTADNFPVIRYGTSRLAWNQWTGTVWQQAEVTNNRFVLCHIFATGDQDQPWIAVQGQAEYVTLPLAQAGALSEINSLVLTLPFAEILAVGTVIFQTANAYTNTVKARTRETEEGADWVDWRYSSVSPATPASTIDPAEHKAMDQLVHNIAENSYEEITRTGGLVSAITSYTDSGKWKHSMIVATILLLL